MSGIEHKNNSGRKTRHRISLRITALVLAIFIIASIVCIFSFQKALSDMAGNSKKKVVESVAKMVSSCHNFVARNMLYAELLRSGAADYRQIAQNLRGGAIGGGETSTNEYINGLLGDMIESGLLGFKIGYFADPPTPETGGKAVVVASSDKKYISKQVPDDVAVLIDGEKNYQLFENGIPGMGLKGEYLVTSYKLTAEGTSDVVLWYFDFKPMGKLLSGIDSFYSKENRSAVLKLCLVIGLSILGLLIISFLVLGYLIEKRISKPVDELSRAAEKVIAGDMDVRLEIKAREEFSALKSAFNKMITTLSGIISRATGQGEIDEPGKTRSDKDVGSRTYLKPRSTILFQVIALFTVVFIAAGAFFMLSISGSMDSLVKKSEDTVIKTEANLVLSGHVFGMRMLLIKFEVLGTTKTQADSIRELVNSVSTKTISDMQKLINNIFREIVDRHLFNYSHVYCILPAGMITKDYIVAYSSDDKYMFTKPPKEILEFFDKDKDTYKFFKNGISELGLNEPYLASSLTITNLAVGDKAPLVIDFRPMGKEVEAIDDFYKEEQRKLFLTMGFVIVISILLLILITALTLAYLIRKWITGPIDELVAVADKVMEGDLDVQVQIRPGEQLENLKIAFNEMIKALRELVERSVGG